MCKGYNWKSILKLVAWYFRSLEQSNSPLIVAQMSVFWSRENPKTIADCHKRGHITSSTIKCSPETLHYGTRMSHPNLKTCPSHKLLSSQVTGCPGESLTNLRNVDLSKSVFMYLVPVPGSLKPTAPLSMGLVRSGLHPCIPKPKDNCNSLLWPQGQ